MMGPALREGYWTPEDYTDYGDKYTDNITIPYNNLSVNGSSGLLNFIWDEYKINNDE
jgi:hypothetical protein